VPPRIALPRRWRRAGYASIFKPKGTSVVTKTFKWWPAIGIVTLAGAVLAGCGSGGGSSSNASLRLANATLTHSSLDLLINSSTAGSGVASDTVSTYASPSSGSITLQINDSGSGTALATTIPTLAGGAHYTLLAYESGGAVKTAFVNEDFAAPSANSVQIRVYDAAVSAGRLDVYITANGSSCASSQLTTPSASFSSITAPVSTALLTFSPGTYRVCVTAFGNKTDLRMDSTVALTNQQIATVVLTPATGGSLLNGSTVIQQGAYAASRNPNARIRLAAAALPGATVAATTGSGTVDSGVAPSFGFYTLVPASSSLSVSVNSQSVQVANPTALTAGSDLTLLVYGAPGGPTATLVADDNSPPSDASTVKVRMINGVTGNVGNATLTANNSPVGIAVPAGTAASDYVGLTVPTNSNTFNLVLTSSAVGTLLNTNTTLNANTVYTILAGGDVSATQLLIR
jgi:hypothetical protein